jgi:hypothetical protein
VGPAAIDRNRALLGDGHDLAAPSAVHGLWSALRWCRACDLGLDLFASTLRGCTPAMRAAAIDRNRALLPHRHRYAAPGTVHGLRSTHGTSSACGDADARVSAAAKLPAAPSPYSIWKVLRIAFAGHA